MTPAIGQVVTKRPGRTCGGHESPREVPSRARFHACRRSRIRDHRRRIRLRQVHFIEHAAWCGSAESRHASDRRRTVALGAGCGSRRRVSALFVVPSLDGAAERAAGLELRGAPLLARLFGAAPRRAMGRADQLLEAVWLSDAADKYPQQLCGGMQQRLSIAQSVICEPKVLLLDEPLVRSIQGSGPTCTTSSSSSGASTR